MKNGKYLYIIPPNGGLIAASAILFIVGFYGFWRDGFTIQIAGVAPTALLAAGLTFLVFANRTAYFTENTIYISYIFPFIKRKIDVSRIKQIDFYKEKKDMFMFIVLDDCPGYGNSNARSLWYGFSHPFRVITISINGFPEENFDKTVRAIKKHYPEITAFLYSK